MSDPRYPELYERDEARRTKSGPLGYLLAVITGIVVPVQYSGKLYLVRELQKYGANTSTIPEVCLRELTDEAIRQCKDQAKFEGRNWRTNFTLYIEQIAFLIACRLSGDAIYLSAMTWPVPFVNILRKYGLPADLGDLDPDPC
jgi:hypothetical protein